MFYEILYFFIIAVLTAKVIPAFNQQDGNVDLVSYGLGGSYALLLWLVAVNYTRAYGATLGAFHWNWFAWTTALSAALQIWHDPHSRRALDRYFDPMVYFAFMARAHYQLFVDDDIATSVTFALYVDLILMVCADLIDTILMTDLLKAQNSSPSLDIAGGVVDKVTMVTGSLLNAAIWFFHGTVFPRAGTKNRAGEDIALSRKAACLTSLLLCDLPFLIIRLVIWYIRPYRLGLQGMIIKNLVCIPLEFSKYLQCRKIESTWALSQMTYKSNGKADTSLNGLTGQGLSTFHSRPAIESQSEESIWQTQLKRISISLGLYTYGQTEAAAKDHGLDDESSDHSLEFPESPPKFSRVEAMKKRLQIRTMKEDACAAMLMLFPDELSNFGNRIFLHYIKDQRELPPRAFGVSAVMRQALRSLRYGTPASWSQRLPLNISSGTRFDRIRLTIPCLLLNMACLIITWSEKMLLDGEKHIELFYNLEAHQSKLIIGIISGSCCGNFLSHAGLATSADNVFSTIAFASQLITFHIYLRALGHGISVLANILASDEFNSFNLNRLEMLRTSRLVFLFAMGLTILVRMLNWLFNDFCILFTNTTHITFKKDEGCSGGGRARGVKEAHLGGAKASLNQHDASVDGDYPMSGLLLYRLCSSYYPPISYHKLLLSSYHSELIKAVRVVDALGWLQSQRCWWNLILLTISCICQATYGIIILSVCCISTQWLYWYFSQASALFGLRRSELKRILQTTVQAYDQIDPNFLDREPDVVLATDTDSNIKLFGLFTSPGPLR